MWFVKPRGSRRAVVGQRRSAGSILRKALDTGQKPGPRELPRATPCPEPSSPRLARQCGEAMAPWVLLNTWGAKLLRNDGRCVATSARPLAGRRGGARGRARRGCASAGLGRRARTFQGGLPKTNVRAKAVWLQAVALDVAALGIEATRGAAAAVGVGEARAVGAGVCAGFDRAALVGRARVVIG